MLRPKWKRFAGGAVVLRYILLPCCVFVSCSKPQNGPSEADHSTNEVPAKAEPSTPITGAFGWRLGDVIRGGGHRVEQLADGRYGLSCDSNEDKTITPFSHIYVLATKEGRIYRITGWIDLGRDDADYSRVYNIAQQTLSEKYQTDKELGQSTTYHYFGDEKSLIELEAKPYCIEVSYSDRRLTESVIAEIAKQKEEESQRRDKTIRDSVKGL
jgi:hypothetical protein